MNLREEIIEILNHSWDDEHDQAVDKILKLIEKRIDKEIQSLSKPSIRNNPMVIQKRDILREFKKEMLK